MATQTLLRLPQVEGRTGYKRSTIYRLVKTHCFPAPISLGSRASAWIESEVDQWIEGRIADSREKASQSSPRVACVSLREGGING